MKKGNSVIDRSVEVDVNRALSRATRSLQGGSIVKRMTAVVAVATTAGGVVSLQLSSTSVNSTASEWASFAARYIDYRVLKMKVSYLPIRVVNTQNGATALSLVPGGVVAADPSGSAFPTTLATGWVLEASKLHQLSKSWSYAVRASQEEHMIFNPTSASIPAANRFAIVGIFGGGDASTTYGNFFYEWWTEFRGSQ